MQLLIRQVSTTLVTPWAILQSFFAHCEEQILRTFRHSGILRSHLGKPNLKRYLFATRQTDQLSFRSRKYIFNFLKTSYAVERKTLFFLG